MRSKYLAEAVRTEAGTMVSVILIEDAKLETHKRLVLVNVVNESFQKVYSHGFRENLTMDEILDVLEKPVRVAYIPPPQEE